MADMPSDFWSDMSCLTFLPANEVAAKKDAITDYVKQAATDRSISSADWMAWIRRKAGLQIHPWIDELL